MANHLLIGLGRTGETVLNEFRERVPALKAIECLYADLFSKEEKQKKKYYPGEFVSLRLEAECEDMNEHELSSQISNKYVKLQKASGTNYLYIHLFVGLPDEAGSKYTTWLVRQVHRMYPNAPMDIHLLLPEMYTEQTDCRIVLAELDALNIEAERIFTLFPYTERNEYGHKVSRPTLARMVANVVYFSFENNDNYEVRTLFHRYCCLNELPYALVEFDEETPHKPAHTKAITSLGMVRIVYPEKQLCEHIVCTLLEQNIQALLHDADKTTPKDYREFIKNSYQLAYWKLSEEYLTLNRLDDEESIRSCFWNYIHTIPYEEVKTKEPNPLQYINSLYEETYQERFRNVGVERYYEENWASRRYRASDIIQNVQKYLLNRWQAGELSLWNMQEAVNALRNYLVELRICMRQERIPHLEKEIKALEEERLSLLDEYMSLGIIERLLVKKDEKLYYQYRDLLSQLYESKTRLKAYWFAGELLEWIINYVDYLLRDIRMWTDDLKTVQAEALRRIDNLEEAFGQTDGLVIGIFDKERLQAFENSLICDPTFMESIRHKLSDYLSGSKEETPKPTEIVQAAYELFMGEIKMFDDRNGGDERFFDLRLLRQLSRQSQNDPNSIRAFVQSIKKRAGAYIRLNPDETDRLRQNNAEAGTFTGVLVCLPTHYDGEKQQEYIKQFKQACEEQFPNIIWTKGKCDEITIIKCLSGFSMRCIE